MEAVLHVKNLAFCKIEIEDGVMPPSYNLIDHILMHEGMGIAVPTLTLYLFDQTGTLQNDLNLVQGTKCSITLARDGLGDEMIKRTFSFWGLKRSVSSEGPQIQAVFILDVPKWSAGVYCENYRSTSAEAIQRMAMAAGLTYSGPRSGTDDVMNWLNINTTRSSFSEDVAMRGYASDSSCMARVLTLDSEVRYKDLFEELAADHVATMLLNAEAQGEKNPYVVRETEETSNSGPMAHWMNYGQIQYEHSLNIQGQQVTDRILVPVMGDAFPVSERVKALISDSEGARVTYTGFDPGTEPKPASNLHENYERAFYQNLRSLGLFCERTRVLVDDYTDIHSFDCLKYVQRDPVGHQLLPSKSMNGKYIVAGRTIRIKNGHVYAEVFDLVRPYVSNPGKSSQSGGGTGGKQAAANEGPFDLAAEAKAKPQTKPTPPQSDPNKKEVAPEMDRAVALMASLDKYADANPAIPDTPMGAPGTMTPSSPQSVAQDDVRAAVADIHADKNPISDEVNKSKAGFDPNKSVTVKRVSSDAVQKSANNTIGAMEAQTAATGVPASGPKDLPAAARADTAVPVEKPVLDRYASDPKTITEQKTASVVAPETADKVQKGDPVGDLQNGGKFVEDFYNHGRDDPTGYAGVKAIDAADQNGKLGSNFVFPASSFGLGADDAVIAPKDVAEYLLDYARGKENPQEYMDNAGPIAYQKVFGTRQPEDARSQTQELVRLATNVKNKFGSGEVLAEPVRAGDSTTTSRSIDAGFNISEDADNSSLSDTERAQRVYDQSRYASPSVGSSTADSGFRIADALDSEHARDEDKAKRVYDELKELNPDTTIRSSTNTPERQRAARTQSISKTQPPEVPVRTESTTANAQPFDFQYGEAGVSPLVEKVDSTERASDGQSATVTTTREKSSWATYTRYGSDEAAKQGNPTDGEYWYFPHETPFKTMEEDEGKTHGFPDVVS